MSKVIEILNSKERIDSQINWIVNTTDGMMLPEPNAKKLKNKLEKLAQMVRDDMIEIHGLDKSHNSGCKT